MGDTGFLRFPGNLDPAAQEFIPVSHLPVPVYFQYPQQHHFAPPPPPPPPLLLPPPPLPPPSFITSLSLPPTRSMPSRTLLLSMVPADVSESMVRRELEVFGDVRAVQMERLRDGIVTVHFYDLRQAQAALVEIQEQHMQQQYRLKRHHDAVLVHSSMNFAMLFQPSPPPPPAARGLVAGRVVWAQFTSPVTSSIPDGTNQGTLVVFNLDPRVSPTILRQIFQAFGEVKELRETPRKRHQRFVEFFDVRDAARAMIEMNNKEIHGRNIVIEFSRPGGHCRRKPKPPYSLGIIPAGMPSPLVRQTSGRWVANPEHFNDKRDATTTTTSGEFSRSSSNSSGGSVENSMALLNLGVGPRSSSTTSSGGSTSKQNRRNHHKNRSKAPIKGSSSTSSRRSQVNFVPDPDPRFNINEDVTIESNSLDSRTTVMIKNIPNKYSQKLLLNMLDNHCIHSNEQIGDDDNQPLSSYDFVYLPIDFSNKCNVGYGFVNMTSPEATLRLYRAFHRQSWEVFNSRKICEVTYARLQGLEALKEHFKNSKFPYEVDEYMPVMFTPPRDGRQLTEPVTVSARFIGPRIKCSWPSSEEAVNGIDCGGNDNEEEEYGSGAVYSGGATTAVVA